MRAFVMWSAEFEKDYLLFPRVVRATSFECAAAHSKDGGDVVVVDALTGESRTFNVARSVAVTPKGPVTP